MDTIRAINIRSIKLPLPQPHHTASGVITESPLVLIDIESSRGCVGHALLFTYTATALISTHAITKEIADSLKGLPLQPNEIHHQLLKRFRLLGTQGLVGMAIAGIDMALWDCKLRSTQSNLVEHFGGQHKKPPIYGGIGYGTVDQCVAEALYWKKHDVSAVKAKIGYPTLSEDICHIAAIREAMGDDAHIMVDYNQCLTPQEAIQRINAFDRFNLTWVEEPTLANDFSGHQHISKEVCTPIQCGENWWGARELQTAIEQQASDYMMPDVMKIGGITGWNKAAAICAEKGIKISSHLWPEVSAQLLNLSPTAHWLEYIDWWNPVLKDPLCIENGYAITEGMTGTGIEWNEEVIAEYQL